MERVSIELLFLFFKSFLSQVLSKIYWRMHAERPRVPTTSFQSLILLTLSAAIQLSGVFKFSFTLGAFTTHCVISWKLRRPKQSTKIKTVK